jgi:hypothetical protein
MSWIVFVRLLFAFCWLLTSLNAFFSLLSVVASLVRGLCFHIVQLILEILSILRGQLQLSLEVINLQNMSKILLWI